ncbi:MAG: N-formylglutamate amidohydrolase [Myxococcales bacterium]|nr:N-formylglutamate amidohydrolase [Myxococcales bacterium]
MRAPFELLEPTGPETPVIVEIPHAGVELPATFLEPLAVPARSLGRDADLYVDALYEDAPREGATVVVARTSRYLVDLNRGEGDVDSEVVEGARADVRMQHGLVWRTTSDGEPALTRKLRPEELEERLEYVWRPYHRALAEAIARKSRRFGKAILLAAHSMPSVERSAGRPGARGWGDAASGGRAGHRDTWPGARPSWRESWSPGEQGGPRGASQDSAGSGPPPSSEAPGNGGGAQAVRAREGAWRQDNPRARADVVPGTRGRRSADGRYIDAVEAHATENGWTVRHDDPYAGGFTTQHYGRPSEGVHAIQVELARRLYLDEDTLRPNAHFDAARAWCRSLVERLGRLGLGA